MNILAWSLFFFLPFIHSGYALPKLFVLGLGALWIPARRFDSMDFPLKLLWLVLLVGTVFSIDPYQSIVGTYNDWSHGLLASAVLTIWILRGNGEEPDTARLADLIILMAAMAFDQRMWTGHRAGLTIGDPVALGSLFALGAPLVVLHRRARLPILILGLWATGSRGAWVASLLGLLAW